MVLVRTEGPDSSATSDDAPKHHARIYYPQLDGLRGIAVALVLIGHVSQFSRPLNLAGNQLAQLGVVLFFALSGFLITTLMMDERERTGRVSLLGFYARRSLRIFPAFYAYLAILLVLAYIGRVDDLDRHTLAASALYLRNLAGHGDSTAHFWSLALEEQFYLAWPIAFVRLPERALAKFLVVVILLECVVRAVFIYCDVYEYSSGVFYLRPYFRFDSILIGCWLAVVGFRRSEGDSKRVGRRALIRLLPSLEIGAIVALLIWTSWAEGIPALRPVFITVQMFLATMVLGCVIHRGVKSIDWLLCSAPLRWLGRISYSIYIWQQLFIVVKSPPWGSLRTFPFDVLSSIAIAVGSYFLVEAPFNRLKRRIA